MEQEVRNRRNRSDQHRPIFRLPTYRGRSVLRAVLPLAIPLFVVMILLIIVVVGQRGGDDPLRIVSDNLDIPEDTFSEKELFRIVEGSSLESSESPAFNRFLNIVRVTPYTIVAGDTLTSIGIKFGVTPETIASYNGISLYGDLVVGNIIRVPGSNGRMYTVQSGDSLSVIAQRFGVTMQDVIDANDLTSTTIFVGQKLFLPDMYVGK